MSKNDELRKWNETIGEGEEFLARLRRDAIAKKNGWHRRALLRLIAFMERWIARGKRWRDADMFDD